MNITQNTRVPMIALKPQRYGTRMLKAGEEFEATSKEARLLRAIKRAKDAPVRVTGDNVEVTKAPEVPLPQRLIPDIDPVDTVIQPLETINPEESARDMSLHLRGEEEARLIKAKEERLKQRDVPEEKAKGKTVAASSTKGKSSTKDK